MFSIWKSLSATIVAFRVNPTHQTAELTLLRSASHLLPPPVYLQATSSPSILHLARV